MKHIALFVALALALATAACTVPSTVAPTFAVSTYVRPFTCLGGMYGSDTPLILHGRLASGRADVWANQRQQIAWPAGYYATFEPELVMHDSTGAVRGIEGDDMTSGSGRWKDQQLCPTGGANGLSDPDLQVVVAVPG